MTLKWLLPFLTEFLAREASGLLMKDLKSMMVKKETLNRMITVLSSVQFRWTPLTTWLNAWASVMGTVNTSRTLTRPAYSPGPLHGRDEPVPKKLLLPAFSLPTVLREVIGLFTTARLLLVMAVMAAKFEKPRVMFNVTRTAFTMTVRGTRTWNALWTRLI